MIVTMAGGSPVSATVEQMGYWGYRVLYVSRRGYNPRTDHRLTTARSFVHVLREADWADEDTRDRWLADYDFVLIDGSHNDPAVYYRVPDLVVLPCRTDAAGVEAAERTVAEWTRLRTGLPVDRDQLLVVPLVAPGPGTVAALGPLCRNWCDAGVPVENVLPSLFGPSVDQLAALIAHRCARTDLLVSAPDRFFEAARKLPANAFTSDVVVVRDERHRRLATQLENQLRAVGLRVPEISPSEVDSWARAVCVLVDRGSALTDVVRAMTRWSKPNGPVPLIITALLPGARPSTLHEPLFSGEWLTLETDRRHVREAAQQIARLLRP